MNEPFGIILLKTPPTISIPNESGVASITVISNVDSLSSPHKSPPWIAAPVHTASSGLIPVFGSFPLKNSFTIYLIFGILDEPPTNTISCI
jgi:hypothetical protein